MEIYYLTTKHIHLFFIISTIFMFNLRFLLRFWQPQKPLHIVLRILPHINDTMLLFTGMMLMAIASFSPFTNAKWLGIKLILVVVYIVFGMIGIKNPPRSMKSNFAYIVAMLVLFIIIWLAHCKLSSACSIFTGWSWIGA